MERRQLRTEVTRAVELDYLIAEPSGLSEPWPLLLFLHGAGERGDDLDLVAVHGPPKQAAAGTPLPFLMVAPQCPAGSWWTWQTDALLALLTEIIDSYPVAADRVYLTGLSMGGIGAWDLAARRPDLFAAVVPICGDGRRYLVPGLTSTPIWAFHNSDDPLVPVQGTLDLVEGVREAGGDVRATINTIGGHDAWTAAYDDPELYRWMLDQRRDGGPESGSG